MAPLRVSVCYLQGFARTASLRVSPISRVQCFYGHSKQVRKMRIKVYLAKQHFVLANRDGVELASLVSAVRMH